MDGCLVDSESVYVRVWKEIFDSHHLNISMQEIQTWTGLGWHRIRDKMQTYLPDGYNPDVLRDEREAAFYRTLDKGGVKLKPHALEIIHELRKRNIKVGIGTSTYQDKASVILRHFGIDVLIDFVVYGDDVKHTKPAPDVFERCYEVSGFEKNDILIFEDSLNGLRAANAAEIDVVFVPDFRHYTLEEADYIACIESFKDIVFEEE